MATGWNDEELKASVDVYFQILIMNRNGTPYVKSELYSGLAKLFPSRTSKSFEFRMQNISYVFLLLRREWAQGLKPASNVGTGITSRLLNFIKPNLSKDETLAPKLSKQALAVAVRALAKDGQVLFPFSVRVQPEDLEWSEETDAIWSSVARGESNTDEVNAPTGTRSPQQIETITRVFVRDRSVVDWVLLRAAGKCECCNSSAPFITAAGQPFLEVHHLLPLAQSGSDTPGNAVAGLYDVSSGT